VRYEIFYILPIMIIAHKIYHDMIIITIYRIRANIGRYNIWRFVEIMDFGEILIWRNHSKTTRVMIDML